MTKAYYTHERDTRYQPNHYSNYNTLHFDKNNNNSIKNNNLSLNKPVKFPTLIINWYGKNKKR